MEVDRGGVEVEESDDIPHQDSVSLSAVLADVPADTKISIECSEPDGSDSSVAADAKLAAIQLGATH